MDFYCVTSRGNIGEVVDLFLIDQFLVLMLNNKWGPGGPLSFIIDQYGERAGAPCWENETL